MYIGWTKHLPTPEDKERFEKSIYGAKQVLDRLKALIEQEERDLDQTELDPKAYDNPSWAYKQAFKNGFRKGLHFTKTLTDLDKQVLPKENHDR